MPRPTDYSVTQIRLHWAVAVLIAAQYLFADPMSEAWRAMERGAEVGFSPLVLVHLLGGAAVLVLVLWRLVLRVIRGVPQPPAEESAALKVLAAATHVLFYVLLIGLPVSGAVAWFGGSSAGALAHDAMRALMLAFVALHVVGALYHQFVLKNDLILRMLRRI